MPAVEWYQWVLSHAKPVQVVLEVLCLSQRIVLQDQSIRQQTAIHCHIVSPGPFHDPLHGQFELFGPALDSATQFGCSEIRTAGIWHIPQNWHNLVQGWHSASQRCHQSMGSGRTALGSSRRCFLARYLRREAIIDCCQDSQALLIPMHGLEKEPGDPFTWSIALIANG